MDCEMPSESLRKRLRQAASRDSVPLTGMLELTRRCPFRCPHCYAGPATDAAGEQDTAYWKAILDEAAAAGCLELVMTGGEPLLRTDFDILYVHARRLGMEVTVFTNAVLVDDRVTGLFHEWPPREVEVSVYGLTEETSRRVTGLSGACDLQWRGIRLLRERGIPVTLKILGIQTLRAEADAIEGRARDWGLKCRRSVELTPRLNGDRAPLALRLDPEEALDWEARDPNWAMALENRMKDRKESPRQYPCAAGQYGFFIDAEGFVQPCLALRAFRERARPGEWLDAWRRVREAARAAKFVFDKPIQKPLYYLTNICIAMAEWSGVSTESDPWRDRLAKARIDRMSRQRGKQEGSHEIVS